MLPYSTNDSCFCLDLYEIGIYQNIANIFCFCQDPQRVWKNIFFTQSDNVLCLLYLTTSHALFDHLQYSIMIKHSCLYIWGIQSISHPLTTNNTPMQVNNIPPTQSAQIALSYCCYQQQPCCILEKSSPTKALTYALFHRTLTVHNAYPTNCSFSLKCNCLVFNRLCGQLCSPEFCKLSNFQFSKFSNLKRV